MKMSAVEVTGSGRSFAKDSEQVRGGDSGCRLRHTLGLPATGPKAATASFAKKDFNLVKCTWCIVAVNDSDC